MEILKERSLECICCQPYDNTYYTDGSSDGTRIVVAVVQKEEEISIRLNDAALVGASETRDNVTVHTNSLTHVNLLNTRKLDLNTIARTIRDAVSRITQSPNVY